MEYIGLAFLIWCLFTNYQERLQALADIGKAWRGAAWQGSARQGCRAHFSNSTNRRATEC